MLTAILISAAAGLVVGGGGVLLIQRGGGSDTEVTVTTDAPKTVEAVTGVVDATGDAATAIELAELRLQAQIAGSSVKVIGMQRLAEIGDARLVGAITAYDVCVSAAQGKGDSAAFNCEEAQKAVAAALDHINAE